GLNDLTAGGAYEDGLVAATYVVTVSTAAATDKFTWSKNGGTASAEIEMTGAAQELEKGVTVTFAATTGHTEGDYWTINVTVNDVADLVNDIEFGLKNLALGTKSKIQLFADKSEGTLTFNTHDRNGTVQTTTIQWQGAWNSAVTRFIIDWFNDRIVLSVINANTTTEVVLATHKTRVGQHPLNPYVKVTGAENLDVDYISIERTKSSSIMLI
ncbi:MAG TPA: hypothetical protein PK616_07580, partial [Fibrobacteraceae bacterium]|nr:hypothetical protein [Fibrobacteraceae bacterium]